MRAPSAMYDARELTRDHHAPRRRMLFDQSPEIVGDARVLAVYVQHQQLLGQPSEHIAYLGHHDAAAAIRELTAVLEAIARVELAQAVVVELGYLACAVGRS